MKYDSQLTTVKNLLPTAQNILITLPSNSDIDKLSAGLSLFLALEAAGKNVSIACDDTIRVGQAHLFGIDHVKITIPSSNSGNLVLTLEGVASINGTIPALERLDWYAENNNLNLVFHVLPGQTFQPVRITPQYQTGGFNVIFTVGANSLSALGQIYQSNPQAFSNAHIVNIDNQTTNSNFGQTNIVDSIASCVSEVMGNVITDLGYVMDQDMATNLLAGIFDATQNLTNPKVSADTYLVVANCLKVGGKKPEATSVNIAPTQPAAFGAQFFQTPTGPQPDLSALIPQDSNNSAPIQPSPVLNDFTVPTAVSDNNITPAANVATEQSSPEERPAEEGVVSETVEPDWLTPKIFKGTSLG